MKHTIKSSQDIERLFRQGRYYKTKYFSARILDTPQERDRSGRVAFLAGKRLGNAVYRNRCKRVLREMCRRAQGPWPGYDVAFIAVQRTPIATQHQLDLACKGLISAYLPTKS